MLKRTLYPKTKRVSTNPKMIEVTEKLDGSNLCMFRKGEELIIAQRNTIFVWNKIEEFGSQGLYKGLYGWLKENAETILKSLHDGSGVCGEWVAMGKIKYGGTDIDKKFYIFAKSRLIGDDLSNYEIQNIIYSHSLIHYAFIDGIIPEFIGKVPLIKELYEKPSKLYLDELYEFMCNSKDRKVEGFIVNDNEFITKYVRLKDGKLTEHKGE